MKISFQMFPIVSERWVYTQANDETEHHTVLSMWQRPINSQLGDRKRLRDTGQDSAARTSSTNLSLAGWSLSPKGTFKGSAATQYWSFNVWTFKNTSHPNHNRSWLGCSISTWQFEKYCHINNKSFSRPQMWDVFLFSDPFWLF